ncbi:hypothetical protein IMG5_100590 [Ichthyophthirius multifiliis]|uniref:Uncharacterized protein n=1 Tax=Ichthyophthirius multifiliis TaxID=5932 RepID=G0QSB0_ICHMU|nr:hypothetical protein IMG5_100590 [Ichthyophthirius multifiliis]EGR31908.1 hypothetical protein IMG5_100590 [Ichthyophthirius multifiliis]|eukprot:XP_004035394.1 hypothetical protein IMG5_100590 [Ichthyophthirius multifiliis]
MQFGQQKTIKHLQVQIQQDMNTLINKNLVKQYLIYKINIKNQKVQFVSETHDFNRTGLLQRFIQPKGEFNFVIKALWSQHLTYFERLQNKHYINNLDLDIYQRVLTFEIGKSGAISTNLKGTVIINQIDAFCKQIKDNIQNDKMSISSMINNFKVDNKNKIWFLGCTSIRFFNKKKILNKSTSVRSQRIREIETNVLIYISIKQIKLLYFFIMQKKQKRFLIILINKCQFQTLLVKKLD